MKILDNYLEKKFETSKFKEKVETETEKRVSSQMEKKFKDYIASLDPLAKDEQLPGNWRVISGETIGQTNYMADEFLKEYKEWVYANVNAISEAVADIELELYKYTGEDVKEIFENPILELLNKVNPYMTKSDFIFILQANLLLTGEAPIRLKRTSNNPKTPPTELWPLDPGKLKIIIGKTSEGYEMVKEYKYKESYNNTLTLEPWEVLMIKNVNPHNIWRGVGVVEASARTIDILNYAEEYNKKFFQNSAVPLTLLMTDQELTPQTYNRLKDAWENKYKGVNNAYKNAILEQGLKFQQLQTTNRDMEFSKQQTYLRDKLMAMFKTTKPILGITEDVNRANAEAAEYVFMKHCVKPKMKRIVEYLNEFLMPIYDLSGTLFLDYEDPIQEDKGQKVTEYEKAINKWMTPNEVRKKEGLEPLDGGDEIWQAISLTTMSNPTPNTPDIQTIPKSTEQQGQSQQQDEQNIQDDINQPKMYRILQVKKGFGKKDRLKKYKEQIARLINRNVRIKQLAKELKKQMLTITKTWISKKLNKPKSKYGNIRLKSTQEYFQKSQHSNSDKFEELFKKIIVNKIYIPQRNEIINNLETKGIKFIIRKPKKIAIKSASDYMFDKDKWNKKTIKALLPLFDEILQAQGQEAADLLGGGFEYSLMEEARKFLSKNPTKMAKSMNNTTYSTVRNELSDGLEKGEGIPELSKRITEIYSNFSKDHAEMIARSEVSRATNFATLDSYKQSGVVTGKQWLTAEDERTCEWCAELDGKIIGLNETYFNEGDEFTVDGKTINLDYEDIEDPPLHNSCRCTLIPYMEEIKSIKPKKKKKISVKSKAIKLLEKLDKKIKE